MIIPHIQPKQGLQCESSQEDRLIGYTEDQSATNAVRDTHDIAERIPHLPPAFKRAAISDLLEMWRLHLKTDSWIDGRG